VDAGYFCYLERGRRVPSVIVAEVLIDSFVQAARQGDALADEDLAWLDSIEDHVKGTDPLLNPLAPPEPPEATPRNLTPLPRRRQSARSRLGLANRFHGPGVVWAITWARAGTGAFTRTEYAKTPRTGFVRACGPCGPVRWSASSP